MQAAVATLQTQVEQYLQVEDDFDTTAYAPPPPPTPALLPVSTVTPAEAEAYDALASVLIPPDDELYDDSSADEEAAPAPAAHEQAPALAQAHLPTAAGSTSNSNGAAQAEVQVQPDLDSIDRQVDREWSGMAYDTDTESDTETQPEPVVEAASAIVGDANVPLAPTPTPAPAPAPDNGPMAVGMIGGQHDRAVLSLDVEDNFSDIAYDSDTDRPGGGAAVAAAAGDIVPPDDELYDDSSADEEDAATAAAPPPTPVPVFNSATNYLVAPAKSEEEELSDTDLYDDDDDDDANNADANDLQAANVMLDATVVTSSAVGISSVGRQESDPVSPANFDIDPARIKLFADALIDSGSFADVFEGDFLGNSTAVSTDGGSGKVLASSPTPTSVLQGVRTVLFILSRIWSNRINDFLEPQHRSYTGVSRFQIVFWYLTMEVASKK